jgi:uncharacterized membrane protein YphA (DoxX/SURF4 family)/gas vesicle protein
MLLRRVARPLLSAVFIGQGVDSLLNPNSAAEAAAPTVDGLRALPEPVGSSIPKDAETFAQINAVIQIGAGLLLATGKMPRLASGTLALTVLPANLGAHMFWNESDRQRKAEKRQAFLTDLGLLGGLLIAAADTEGRPSLGWRGRRAAEHFADTVSSALPGSNGSEPLIDVDFGDLSDRLEHVLQRGRELASTAAERSQPYAEAALERGRELASTAAERSQPYAEAALERGRELASTAAERSQPYAEAVLERGRQLANTAADKGEKYEKKARKRSKKLAKQARKRGLELAETARDQGSYYADLAAERGSRYADLAAERGSEWADTARDRLTEEVKKGRKEVKKRWS